MKTKQARNGLYPVSEDNYTIIFNHWHIWSFIIVLEGEFFQLPSSTAVNSLVMKQI
jgi:hypothetical protein